MTPENSSVAFADTLCGNGKKDTTSHAVYVKLPDGKFAAVVATVAECKPDSPYYC